MHCLWNTLLIASCPAALALQANVGLGHDVDSTHEMLTPSKWSFDRYRQGHPTKRDIKEMRRRERSRKARSERGRKAAAAAAAIAIPDATSPSSLSLVERYEHESLAPQTWVTLGPFRYAEYGVDPLRAFGGIWDIVDRAPEELWSQMKEKNNQFALESQRQQMTGHFNGMRSNVSYAAEFAQHHQLPRELQGELERFPTEYGPGGHTVWALAYADSYDPLVFVNFTATVNNLAEEYNGSAVDTWAGGGWAIGELEVPADTTVMVKCTDWFHLESGEQVMQLPDIYSDDRAIHAVHLTQGKHRMFVNFRSRNFWCDVYEDTAAGRANVTGLKELSDVKGPFVQVKGHTISDVVAGQLASPHLALPVLSTAEEPLFVSRVEVLRGPANLTVSTTDDVPIAPGGVRILPLRVNQGAPIECEEGSSGEAIFNLTVAVHPSNLAPPVIANVLAHCVDKPDRGYLVAYPDFDKSIQVLWAAPPNITRFSNRTCPPAGCPMLLSLHGAGVELGTNWGRNYEYDGEHSEKGKGFPYPAWLVEPSNRGKYGSDWEDQGFDNALSAINYVRDFLPGAPGNASTYKLDKDRVLITGHSMGGHGCLLFATHFPDSLIAAACGAGWTSMESYTGLTNSKLINGTRRGLLAEKRVEHSADYLSANLRGTPMLFIYGSRDDNVPPTESRYMARLITSASGNRTAVTISELENVEHWFVQDVPELTTFLEKHLMPPPGNEALSVPLAPFPETFEFTVTHPATFGTKGFLQLLRQTDPSKPAKFFVQRCPPASANPMCNASTSLLANAAHRRVSAGGDGEGEIDYLQDTLGGDSLWDVETVNVEHFSLKMPENPPEGQTQPQLLRVDGTVFLRHEFFARDQHFCRIKHEVKTGQADVSNLPVWGICKTPQSLASAESGQRAGTTLRAGPLHMVLRQAPVCIVHGSGDGQREEAQTLAFKMYYVSRYATPIVDASPGSTENASWAEAACEGANLVLIGTPSENTLTERYRCAFPYVRFSNDSHVQKNSFALGGNLYTANGAGLLALGALPSGRLAMLINGIGRSGLAQASYAVPVASGKDDADFFVFGPDFGWKGLGGVLASGFLTPTLQIDPAASWTEPQHSVAARTTISEGPLELSEAKCAGYAKDLLADSRLEDTQDGVRGASYRSACGSALALGLAAVAFALASTQ